MKMRNLTHRALALAAALMLLVSLAGCSLLPGSGGFLVGNNGVGQADGTYGDHAATVERRTIPYSQIEYTRPDGDTLLAEMGTLVTDVKAAGSYDRLLECDSRMNALLENFYTMQTVVYIKSDQDVTDEYFEEELRYCDDLAELVSDQLSEFNRVIIEGPYADQYRQDIGDNLYNALQSQLQLSSPAVTALKQQRNQLLNDYNKAMTELTVTTPGGKTLTEDEIEDWDTYLLFFRQNGEKMAELYSKMVALDKEIAEKLGFESAADMYYLSYSRDYTPADAMQYAQHSKEIFARLSLDIEKKAGSMPDMDMDKFFIVMPSTLEKIFPELRTAWDFMIEYEMHDFEPRENKRQGGVAYCTDLYAYDTPFIYGYWDSGFSSATTVMHEFGHFYDGWLNFDQGGVFNLDIAETYSQGLELLMHEYFGDFVSNAKKARLAHLADFPGVLTYQILLEEFTQLLFEMDSFTPQEAADLYANLKEQYGFEAYEDEGGGDFSWFFIPHLFNSPFYTVSYWTSACVALQIWAASKENYQQGVRLYLDMIHSDPSMPFIELLTSVGLHSPGDVETLKTIARNLVEEYGLRPGDYPIN